MNEVTRLLSAIEENKATAEDLLPLVYNELRKLAASKLLAEKPGQTLQATGLVHEAYLRLVGNKASLKWNSRGHFFGAAAEAMRRILIESARKKKRIKRGGDRDRVSFSEVDIADNVKSWDLLELDAALVELEEEMPQVVAVVKLRYFAGLSIAQSAEALDISPRTAHRHWAYAKAWLFRRLSDD